MIIQSGMSFGGGHTTLVPGILSFNINRALSDILLPYLRSKLSSTFLNLSLRHESGRVFKIFLVSGASLSSDPENSSSFSMTSSSLCSGDMHDIFIPFLHSALSALGQEVVLFSVSNLRRSFCKKRKCLQMNLVGKESCVLHASNFRLYNVTSGAVQAIKHSGWCIFGSNCPCSHDYGLPLELPSKWVCTHFHCKKGIPKQIEICSRNKNKAGDDI